MPRARGFSALTEIDALSDQQLRDLALGNWAKLNRVLMARPSASAIRRLLRLELMGLPMARADFLRRLRLALNRANGREALDALQDVLKIRKMNGVPSGGLLERAMR